jgi:hypothetical protein
LNASNAWPDSRFSKLQNYTHALQLLCQWAMIKKLFKMNLSRKIVYQF